MLFLNYQDMSRTLIKRRNRLPASIDLVVGIPRSGMAPAAMLATQFNIPLADTKSFLEGAVFEHGSTKSSPDVARALSDDRTVLIVDDVVGSGRAVRELKTRIAERGIAGRLIYCAVYGPVRRHPDVDIVLEGIDTDHCFQWNILHHRVLGTACVDIDGVLCANPQAHESFEGGSYLRFLDNALNLHRTSGEIGWLVTSRLERHRAQTERWLAANGVAYRHLVMASEADKEDSSAYKARVYRETGAALFIESELTDATDIAALSERPVVCIETMSLIAPAGVPARRAVRPGAGGTAWRRRKARFKLAARRMAGDELYSRMKSVYRRIRVEQR